jgi:hypothetical protein
MEKEINEDEYKIQAKMCKRLSREFGIEEMELKKI